MPLDERSPERLLQRFLEYHFAGVNEAGKGPAYAGEASCTRCFGKGTHALIAGPMERPHPVGSWVFCRKCKGTGRKTATPDPQTRLDADE